MRKKGGKQGKNKRNKTDTNKQFKRIVQFTKILLIKWIAIYN